MVQLSHPYLTTGKAIALTRWTFVGKVTSLLFNMLSRLVITFLPRSKCLLISWLQSPFAVILEPRKIKSATVSTVSPESRCVMHAHLADLGWKDKTLVFRTCVLSVSVCDHMWAQGQVPVLVKESAGGFVPVCVVWARRVGAPACRDTCLPLWCRCDGKRLILRTPGLTGRATAGVDSGQVDVCWLPVGMGRF